MTTIAVVKDNDSKNGWKVLVNYIQRGVVLHNMGAANNSAVSISESQPYDHLILAREET